jgi:NADPH:quinone reductase-like Zn-dependent oxidoreductase
LTSVAGGRIGAFAVQIAKALGAEVTGPCSTRNADTVRSSAPPRSSTPGRTSAVVDCSAVVVVRA